MLVRASDDPEVGPRPCHFVAPNVRSSCVFVQVRSKTFEQRSRPGMAMCQLSEQEITFRAAKFGRELETEFFQ